MQSINTIGTKEADTIVGSKAFRKMKYFEDIPTQLFCV